MPPMNKVAAMRAAKAKKAAEEAAAAQPPSLPAVVSEQDSSNQPEAGPIPSTSRSQSPTGLDSMMPPAKALPTEPMDLDETVEEGTGDTEMLDSDKNGARKVEAEVTDEVVGEEHEEGKATTEVKKASANGGSSKEKTTKPSSSKSKPKADPKGKGKGKAIEKEEEMTNGQSAKEIEMGLEAMGQETYKGKSLTDPVKSVAVSLTTRTEKIVRRQADPS
jgi:DNA-directed RNA polymerase III subunit RPC2